MGSTGAALQVGKTELNWTRRMPARSRLTHPRPLAFVARDFGCPFPHRAEA
jgi:hypothetical protein